MSNEVESTSASSSERETSTTASQAKPAGGSGTSGARVQLRSSLGGRPLDVQASMLTPGEGGDDGIGAAAGIAGSRTAAAEPRAAIGGADAKGSGARAVQRKVSRVQKQENEGIEGSLAEARPSIGIEGLAGGDACSPLARGSSPVVALQFTGTDTTASASGGATPTGPTAPPLPANAPATVTWAKPKKSQSGKAEVWYLVPADETDAAKVDLTKVDQRFYFPADQAMEGKAQAFESALGQHAMTHPVATGTSAAMAQAVIKVLDDYQKALFQAGTEISEMESMVGELVGTADNTWAGSIGTSETVIRAAAAKGTVREQLLIATQFAWNFGAEIQARAQETNLKGFIDGLRAERPVLATQVAKAQAPKKDEKERAASLTNGLPSGGEEDWRKTARADMGQQREMRTTAPEVDTQEAAAKVEPTARTPEQQAQAGAQPTRTTMTGADMNLSSREARTQLGAAAEGKSDEQVLEMIRTTRLNYNEGIKRFLLSESHPWVQAIRANNLPGGAGPSGSTQGVMQARQLLNVGTPEGARAAAIGYLLPIHAHSLIEILIGAAAVDGPGPVHMDFGVYLHLSPFDGRAVYADEAFWKAVEATEKEKRGGGLAK